MINPFYDGAPPRPKDDPVRLAEERSLMLTLAIIEKPPKRQKYFDTHGPWDAQKRCCLSCGLSELSIHNDLKPCVSRG